MYIFIIFGAISIAWGIISMIFLPDGPSNARFLTHHERAIAVERVAANKAGVKTHRFKPYQAIQTLRDPKTWILFIMAVSAQSKYCDLEPIKASDQSLIAKSSQSLLQQ